MTYQEADRLLQGRCKQSRRIANNTYLKRDGLAGTHAIHIRFHSTNIITLYPDGKVRVSTGGFNTVTTRARLSRFLPQPFAVGSCARNYGHVAVLYSHSPRYWTPVAILDSIITIEADGSLPARCAKDLEMAFQERQEEIKKARRERYKERFWILKARRGGKLRRPLTLEIIQAERNISTRTAMIKIYGIERFLTDINAEVIDTFGEYSLLSYSMEWTSIRALKMVCPSTKVAYIHPVDPHCSTVGWALDWMFDTENYLHRLQAEA